MIVPLTYFIEKPFQNWTREGSELLGSVMLYLDYDAPIDAIRAKAQEIVEGSPLWNGKVFAVQVTDAEGSETIEVRVLMSATSRRRGLRPALRGAREADRLSQARASQRAAAPAPGGGGRSGFGQELEKPRASRHRAARRHVFAAS